MRSIRTILAATDQSPQGDAAVCRAFAIEQSLDARLVVAQAVADEPLWWIVEDSRLDPQTQREQRRNQIQAQLEERIGTLARNAGAQIQSESIRVRSGKAAEQIKEQARLILADLIVLGAHGKNHFRDWLVGTTAERVIQTSEQSVLVVKNQAAQPYEQVAVAVDFSDASRKAIEQAAAIAPHAHLHLIHVIGKELDEHLTRLQPAENEYADAETKAITQIGNKLDQFAADCDVSPDNTKTHVLIGHPPVAILKQALAVNAQLLVAGSHGLDFTDRFLLGHVAQAALRRAEMDVLITRTPAE